MDKRQSRSHNMKASRWFLLLDFLLISCSSGFLTPATRQISKKVPESRLVSSWQLHDANKESQDQAANAALPPSAGPPSEEDEILASIASAPTSASVATMIPQETKRVLIEELGYRRKDVEELKFDLAPVLLEKRTRCPAEGMPVSWRRPQEELEQENSMMQRLENESKYPLKLPLLGVSLILFGKGFSDALITIIKVNMDFPGASLVEEFLGIPVLLIDAICVAAGAGLGYWTWKTMK